MMTCAPDVRTRHGVLHVRPKKILEYAMWSPDTLWTTMYASVCAGQDEMSQSCGMSTGPRTPEGRARIAAVQRERWRNWRGQKMPNSAGEF